MLIFGSKEQVKLQSLLLEGWKGFRKSLCPPLSAGSKLMFTQMAVGVYGLGEQIRDAWSPLSCREMGLSCWGHVTIESHMKT